MRSINSEALGIGLRSEHVAELASTPQRKDIDFLELAPDNWMGMGGIKEQHLGDIAEKYPLVAHSLSLSIGDCLPLNRDYIQRIRHFLDRYDIAIYSDHLCFSRDEQGYLYDLLPIPRFAKTLDYLVARIDEVQDILQRPLVLENISAYHGYAGEMSELEFWQQLLEKSQCKMLLDINNVYVNSRNHHFDAHDYIRALPSDKISYCHIAGHMKTADMLLDTHGRPVDPAVLALAQFTQACHGSKPLLLERDHHLPPLETLCAELGQIKNALTPLGGPHA